MSRPTLNVDLLTKLFANHPPPRELSQRLLTKPARPSGLSQQLLTKIIQLANICLLTNSFNLWSISAMFAKVLVHVRQVFAKLLLRTSVCLLRSQGVCSLTICGVFARGLLVLCRYLQLCANF